MTDDEILELKRKFAKGLLLAREEPYTVALRLTGNDGGLAVMMCQRWQGSQEIELLKEELREELGELALLPSHSDLAAKVWAKLNNRYIDDKDFTPMARLYGELIGAVNRANSGTTINDNSTRISYSQTNQNLALSQGIDQIEAAKEYSMIMGDVK